MKFTMKLWMWFLALYSKHKSYESEILALGTTEHIYLKVFNFQASKKRFVRYVTQQHFSQWILFIGKRSWSGEWSVFSHLAYLFLSRWVSEIIKWICMDCLSCKNENKVSQFDKKGPWSIKNLKESRLLWSGQIQATTDKRSR